MKRRTTQGRSRRARKSSRAPYTKYNKRPYVYPFPTGEGHRIDAERRGRRNNG